MDTATFLARHFADLRDDELIEIRCIHEPKDAKPPVQRYFTDPAKAAAFALAGNARGYHAFYGANPRSQAAIDAGRHGKDAVARVTHLWVDIDDVRPHEAVTLQTIDQEPEATIDTGGGVQALWRVEPIDPDTAEIANRAIALFAGGDGHATDAARVLRLPGTVNHKPKYPPGTTAAVVDLGEPGRAYPVAPFLALEPTVARPPVAASPPSPRDDDTDPDEFYDALAAIDPWSVGYDEWLRILMAIHAFDPGQDGLLHAETWGRGKRGEIARKWHTFKREGSNPATVFHFARAAGWRPRERPLAPLALDDPPAPDDPAAPAPRPKARIALTTLADFFNEQDDGPRWVVDDLLNAGGTSLLVAKPKVGKSTFAANLALCVAAGLPFLDRATRRGAVHVYSMEVHRAFVREQYRLLVGAYDLAAPPDIRIHAGTGRTDRTLDQVAELILRERPALVVLDTLAKVVDTIKDGNDYLEVYEALRPVAALAEASGAHIVCVHHANKGLGEGGDAVMGSVGFAASVDLTMLLRRDREADLRTLTLEARFLPERDPLAFDFDDRRRIVALGRRDAVLRETAEERLLAQIAQTPGVTAADLKLYTGLPNEIAGPALHRLIQTYRVAAEGSPKRHTIVAYSPGAHQASRKDYHQEEL